MSVWAETSPQALQAQLGKALFVVHFLAGGVLMHVLSTLWGVEWLVSRGRVACRWSLFNAVCCRILPIVSIASLIAWLDFLSMGQRRIMVLFILSRTTLIVSQIFSLMILTLGVASICDNRQVTYAVEMAFLGITGMGLATFAGVPSSSIAPVSPTLFAFMLTRLIFCGALFVVALWGISNSCADSTNTATSPVSLSRAKFLYKAMRKHKLEYYTVALLAQLAPPVVFATAVDSSGLLRLTNEYVSFTILTFTGSLLFKHLAFASNRCPVTQYCVIIGLILHISGFGRTVYDWRTDSHSHHRPHAISQDHIAAEPASPGCPHNRRQRRDTIKERAAAAVTVLAEAGLISLTTRKHDNLNMSDPTTSEGGTCSSGSRSAPHVLRV
ncbi:hypothetical protein BC835DRAFT_674647 [Cytidiella melzeri]|nr:hypothetical protein BC835DRAFT_674647 [Cytidiella melzeri]